MDELLKMRDELNAKTDALNNEIHNVEGILNKLNLGVAAKIEISKDQWLSYGKLEGNWGLLSISGKNKPIPLVCSSRDIRISSMSKLHGLLKELEEEVLRQIKSVKSAVVTAEEFYRSMK